jgi:hypothetical protein
MFAPEQNMIASEHRAKFSIRRGSPAATHQLSSPGELRGSRRLTSLDSVSKRRSADDDWAQAMEKELREIIRTKLPVSRNSRVFCNSIGCLFFVERRGSLVKSAVIYRQLLGKGGAS